jgi:hypothetical protein
VRRGRIEEYLLIQLGALSRMFCVAQQIKSSTTTWKPSQSQSRVQRPLSVSGGASLSPRGPSPPFLVLYQRVTRP